MGSESVLKELLDEAEMDIPKARWWLTQSLFDGCPSVHHHGGTKEKLKAGDICIITMYGGPRPLCWTDQAVVVLEVCKGDNVDIVRVMGIDNNGQFPHRRDGLRKIGDSDTGISDECQSWMKTLEESNSFYEVKREERQACIQFAIAIQHLLPTNY